MLKRMVGVWLAGLGLATVGLAQDAAPSQEQIQAARKKMRSARGVVNKMAKALYKEDQALAALKAKSDETAKAVSEAVDKLLAATPETKALLDKDAAIAAQWAELRKEGAKLRGKKDKEKRAELQAKGKDLQAQRAEIRKQLGKPRGKARRDPSVAPLSKAASEARKAHRTALHAKLSATPEGQKALADADEANKAYRQLFPRKKRAPRKPRVRKPRGRKKDKDAPAQN